VGAEYRVDPETGDWHIVAPERAARPSDLTTGDATPCPFDPGREAATPPEVLRIPADTGKPWRVRVVPNRFAIVAPATVPTPAGAPAPATAPAPPGAPAPAGAPALSLAPAWASGVAAAWAPDGSPATGWHEVVIESPHHDGDLRFADPAQTAEVLRAMRERCRALTAAGAAAVVVFRNHGAAAGTSLRHPHSQIVALDEAPPGLLRRWERCRRHLAATGRRLHDDLAAAERRDRVRVVADADGVLVYQPRAASVAHQTVLLPRDAAADLAGASDEALDAVARMLPRVAAAIAAVRDDPAYNLVVHAGPAGDDSAPDWYRWHIGLYPRVTRRAGLEFATGLGVNPTVPEQTAPQLRAALPAG
jgi:UDPglucose--hexose-1-phosphate uridylyltransferase